MFWEHHSGGAYSLNKYSGHITGSQPGGVPQVGILEVFLWQSSGDVPRVGTSDAPMRVRWGCPSGGYSGDSSMSSAMGIPLVRVTWGHPQADIRRCPSGAHLGDAAWEGAPLRQFSLGWCAGGTPQRVLWRPPAVEYPGDAPSRCSRHARLGCRLSGNL